MIQNDAILSAHILWAYGKSCSFISEFTGFSAYKVRNWLAKSGARPMKAVTLDTSEELKRAIAALFLPRPTVPDEVKDYISSGLPENKAQRLWPNGFDPSSRAKVVELRNGKKGEDIFSAHILVAYGRSCNFIATILERSELKIREWVTYSGARCLGDAPVKVSEAQRRALAALLLPLPDVAWETKEDIADGLPRDKAKALWPEFFKQIEQNRIALTTKIP